MFGRQCRKKGFEHHDIVSVMVEDSGELHTINFCRDILRQSGRKEPVVNSRHWKLPVAESRSRGKLAAGLCTRSCAEDHGDLLGQEKLRDKSAEICDGGNDSGQKVAGGVAIRRGIGLVAGRAGTCHCQACLCEEWSRRFRRMPGRS